jgi:hypothetical protein
MTAAHKDRLALEMLRPDLLKDHRASPAAPQRDRRRNGREAGARSTASASAASARAEFANAGSARSRNCGGWRTDRTERHGLARHGDLPDVSRESPMLRLKPMKPKPTVLPAAASPRQPARPYRRGECRRNLPCRRSHGRTCRLGSRASDRPPILRCCNEERRTQRARLLHECEPGARSRDADDKEPRERRSMGVPSSRCTTPSGHTAAADIVRRPLKQRHRHCRPPVPLRSTSVRQWPRRPKCTNYQPEPPRGGCSLDYLPRMAEAPPICDTVGARCARLTAESTMPSISLRPASMQMRANPATVRPRVRASSSNSGTRP